jgi:hypothetical protein
MLVSLRATLRGGSSSCIDANSSSIWTQFPGGSALPGWQRGERPADCLAPSRRGGERVRPALALDVLDPAELVDRGAGQPPAPQHGERIGRRPGQGGAAARGELHAAAGELGKPAGLYQQRPGERRDRVARIEIPVLQHLGDQRDRGGAGPAALLAAAELPLLAQSQHAG